ncbi:LysM peptidoglycan-binding domain-containing protein [Secundilactobacillus muriivasis]
MLQKTFVTRSLILFGTLIGLGFATTSASAATTYTVKSGDSLWAIADQFNTTTQAIVTANHLSGTSATIHPNERLIVKKAAKSTASTQIKDLPETSTTTKTSTDTNSTATSGWQTMVATAYDPQIAAGGQGTSIPTGTGVAAALDRFPKGTELEIKFQDGHTEQRVVNDTGTFAYSNPNQLDISMTNAEAMQFGRQSIQVRVIG